MFWTLSGSIPSLENIVSLDGKHAALCLRRKRAEVTNFSTWGGYKFSIHDVSVVIFASTSPSNGMKMKWVLSLQNGL
jgi:hypothetical protein